MVFFEGFSLQFNLRTSDLLGLVIGSENMSLLVNWERRDMIKFMASSFSEQINLLGKR